LKTPCSHQLGIDISNKLYRSFLHSWGIAVTLWRATYCLVSSLGCLGILIGPLWTTIQLNEVQPSHKNLHLKTRRGIRDSESWDSVSHYLTISFILPPHTHTHTHTHIHTHTHTHTHIHTHTHTLYPASVLPFKCTLAFADSPHIFSYNLLPLPS